MSVALNGNQDQLIHFSNLIAVQRTCATNGSFRYLGWTAKQLFLWCCLR